MSYTANVPQIGQSLGASRSIINSNFSTIQTTFDVDHKDFNVASAGKHRFVHFVDATSDIPATSATEVALFNKLVSGVPRLFLRQLSSGTQIQLTGLDPTLSTNGKTFLPGGMLLQWGKVIQPNSTTGTVSYSPAFPTTVFGVFFTLARNSSGNDGIWINTAGTNNLSQFAWRSSTSLPNASDFFFWMAIGN